MDADVLGGDNLGSEGDVAEAATGDSRSLPVAGHERLLEAAGALHRAIFQAGELEGDTLEAGGHEALDEVKAAAYVGHVDFNPGAYRGAEGGEQGLVKEGDEEVQHLGGYGLNVFLDGVQPVVLERVEIDGRLGRDFDAH
ncbi:hypothetical protein [Streptomyces sp. NPDC058701]|uniref:hypothetical protein n=1 Tax=Streptomyces sp. NPDC058701 TaxID=3346608 RepID=UPI00364A7597